MRSLFRKRINIQTRRSLEDIRQKLLTVQTTVDWKILVEPHWPGHNLTFDIKNNFFSLYPKPRFAFGGGIYPLLEGRIGENIQTGKRDIAITIRHTNRNLFFIYLTPVLFCLFIWYSVASPAK